MKTLLYSSRIVLLASLLILSTSAFGSLGKVSVDLIDKFDTGTPGDMQSMLVYLTDQEDVRALDDLLFQRQVTRQERHRIVVTELQHAASRSQGVVLNYLDNLKASGDVEGYTAYWIVNAVVVLGNRNAAELIAQRGDVDYLEANFVPELIEPIIKESRRALDSDANTPPPGVKAINAPRVWYELGINGAGALVANLDTGVDGGHPALAARWRGNIAPAAHCWRAPVSGSANPTDTDQHGTHVMGTICGATNGGTGDTTGVAPAALWIGDDAIGQGAGSQLDNDVIDGFQWFADPDGNVNTVDDVPDVVQNSWGVYSGFSGYSDCDNRWNASILALEAAGTVVTFSAGNEGPGAQTHRSPANIAIDSVTFFSIGAVDATSDTIFPYPIASFSSRGPSDCNATIIKPEVAAPGVSVYSSIPGGGYSSSFSGTSMAGPHVAGIVGLMRSANPNVEVRVVKSILMRTARDQDAAGEDNTSGFGVVDAYAAVLQVIEGYGRLSGVIRDSQSLLPLQAQVEILGGAEQTASNPGGNYMLVLPGDSTYTVRYSLYGYTSQDFTVFVAGDDTTYQDVMLVARPVVSLLDEDFETGAPGWSHDAQAGWVDQWHVSTERSRSLTHSYKCGDTGAGSYANHGDARLYSPVVSDLPAEARLTYYYQIDSEISGTWPADSAYDGGVVEVSADGGAFVAVTPINGYDHQFRWRTSGNRPYNGPMPGQRCRAGINSTWTLDQVDLSGFEGQDIQLRFRFGTDSSGIREGWYIDDVLVTAFGSDVLLPVLDLVISVVGSDLELTWTDTGAPMYRVYSDIDTDGAFTTIEGTSVTNSFTVENGFAVDYRKFYIVKSWDGQATSLAVSPTNTR